MAKKETTTKTVAAAGAKAAVKEKAEATANPRLVEAFRNFDTAKEQAKTYLVQVATIVQEEQLTRAEVVASMVEARGVSKGTAESQYSRMKKILSDADTLDALKSGEIDLATARERTKKGQSAPSATKKAESLEKRYARTVSSLVEIVKEMGTDLNSTLLSIKSSLKKAGVK